jgi:ribosome-binding factor A
MNFRHFFQIIKIMETKRQKQVAQVVKRNIGIVLQQEGSYIYGSATLVTVTDVKMSPDFNIAKIYLSVYNREDKEAVINELEANVFRLRQALAHRIKRHVRRIPEIQFYIDETLDEMYRLNELFKNLDDNNQMGKAEEE